MNLDHSIGLSFVNHEMTLQRNPIYSNDLDIDQLWNKIDEKLRGKM